MNRYVGCTSTMMCTALHCPWQAGVKHGGTARVALGLPPEERWHVSAETRAFFDQRQEGLLAAYEEWQEKFAAWRSANMEKAAMLDEVLNGEVPDLSSTIPYYTEIGKGIATRDAGAKAIQSIATTMPFFTSGAADLHGSTKNYLKVRRRALAERLRTLPCSM